MKTKTTRRKIPKIYWVETPDHDEDWFVLAYDKRSAESFFVCSEGYDTGYATAKLCGRVPEEALDDPLPCYGQKNHIIAAGGRFIDPETVSEIHKRMGCGMRTAVFNDQIYREGDIVANRVADVADEFDDYAGNA